VPEAKATRVRAGQSLDLRIPGDAAPMRVTVSRVSPMLTQTSRALWIEADVPNPDRKLQAGLFAEAEIVVDPDATALVVPAAAVSEFAGSEKVWLVRDGKAEEVLVRTGRRSERRIEILPAPEFEPLRFGDLVVSKADDGHAGEVVAVREPSPPAEQAATISAE
jgi:membrane fusion protein (multidrug efflux system)